MARFFYELRKNNNSSSKSAGKFFAFSKSVETMDNRKMSKHIAEHGSVYTPDVIYGVLEKYRSCIVEMLLQSKKVYIDGLGTFYPSLTSKGVADPTKFVPAKHIAGIHIRIRPWSEEAGNLTSKSFLKNCEMEYMGEVETVTVDGKNKIVLHRPSGEEEGGEG